MNSVVERSVGAPHAVRPAPTASAGRTAWIDYGKGIGILLVIYGHLLSSDEHAVAAVGHAFFKLSDSILYSFHMPLFFFLAGLTVARSHDRRGPRRFLRDKLVHLARPYLIWSTLQVIAELCFADHTYRSIGLRDLLLVPVLPREQFWFLYALLWAYGAYAALRWLRLPDSAMLVLAAAPFFFPIPTHLGALDSFSVLLIFLITGATFSDRPRAWRALERLPRGLLLAATLAVSALFLASAWYVFEHCIPQMRLIEVDHGMHPGYFLYLAFTGTAMCVGWSQYLARTRRLAVLPLLGRYSMPIYLTHMLTSVPVRIALIRVLHVRNAPVQLGVEMLAACAAAIALYELAARLRLSWVFQ